MPMILKFIIVTVGIFCGNYVTAQDIQKCRLGNSTCEGEVLVSLAQIVIAQGVPQLGIPSLNPIYLKDVKVPFLDNMLKIILDDGDCYGINTCRLLYYVTNATSFRKIAEVKCGRIAIRGTYTLKTNPLFFPLIGNVSGRGNVSIVAEDWYYKFNYPFKFVKREDGHIYIEADFKAGKHISKVLKNFTVSFDKILVNGYDITKKIVFILNKNWETVLETIGKPFHDVSLEYYFDIYDKYFRAVPADDTFIDDLNLYL